MPKACPYVMVSFFLWGVGLEDFGAEGVVVAEVFEVSGGGVGFEGGSLDVGRVEAKLGLAVERLTLNLRPTFFSF